MSSLHVPLLRVQAHLHIDSHIKTMKQCRLRMVHIPVSRHILNKKIKKGRKMHKKVFQVSY